MYVYADYSGGIYFSDRELDLPELVRGSMSERDFLLGRADSFKDAWNLLKYECGFCGSGGWNLRTVVSAALKAFPAEGKSAEGLSGFERTDGLSGMSDFDVLRLVGRLTGDEVRTFRYSYGDESGFFLAEDSDDAEDRASKLVRRGIWEEDCSKRLEVSESSLAEAEKAFGKEFVNG